MGSNCARRLQLSVFIRSGFHPVVALNEIKQLASRFNLTYRYIDDVLFINNLEFENYLDQMYPVELEIKDTGESITSASYLDLQMTIEREDQLHTSIYDKREFFHFHSVNFPFLSSNIPSSPAYGDFISQLTRYARACSSDECFILRAMRLSGKLLKERYLVERLQSSFSKFNGLIIWRLPLTNAKWHSDRRPVTVTSQPIRLFTKFMTWIPSLTFTE